MMGWFLELVGGWLGFGSGRSWWLMFHFAAEYCGVREMFDEVSRFCFVAYSELSLSCL